MTATTASTAPIQRRAPKTATLAAIGGALAAVVIVAGNVNVPKGETGGTSEGISTGVFCAVVAAVLFGLVIPRVRNQRRAAFILGILSVLSVAVFWSGVTPILAAATFAVAISDESSDRRTTVMRWLAGIVTLLVVGWTLANSHF